MIKPYLYLIKYTINKNSRHKEIFSVVKFQIDESNILDENKIKKEIREFISSIEGLTLEDINIQEFYKIVYNSNKALLFDLIEALHSVIYYDTSINNWVKRTYGLPNVNILNYISGNTLVVMFTGRDMINVLNEKEKKSRDNILKIISNTLHVNENNIQYIASTYKYLDFLFSSNINHDGNDMSIAGNNRIYAIVMGNDYDIDNLERISKMCNENKRIPVFMSFDKHDTLYRVVNIHNELTIRKVVI